MTTREEIREGIAQRIAIRDDKGFLDHAALKYKVTQEEYEFTDRVLSYLDSRGVVLKANRELPVNPYARTQPSGHSEFTLKVAKALVERQHEAYYGAQKQMTFEGYVAVEPLVEE